jgi:hypothetical protein
MIVMPGLVPGIHVFRAQWFEGVEGRNKCGHDGMDVIPGGRRPGRGSIAQSMRDDSLPLRRRSGRE